ncbi:UNVERIFIED_CONTAM: hypothetical protein K2H54_017375 [Gekko kuhli]
MAARSLPVVQRKEQQQDWRVWEEHTGAPDDSLTNLQWLQEFSFLPAAADPEAPSVSSHLRGPSRVPPQGSSYGPASPPAGDTAATGVPPSMGRPTSSGTSFPPPPSPASEEVDYKADARAKPPYSYATLICMAMRASRGAKLTLAAIYAWIMENFGYYRQAEPSWQNSVRHNLSLNKCFRKVPRGKDEPGKGGFWQIDPQYADTLLGGTFPRKRMPALHAGHRSCRRERGHSLPLQGDRAFGGRETAPISPATEPSGETAALPAPLSWDPGLEETLDAAASEDLELRAALGALAPAEDLPSLSHHLPLSALSRRGPPRPETPPADDALVLLPPEPLTEPWEEEEAGADPALGAGWGLEEEEDPCFAQSFLVEMPPWEG